MLNLPGLNRTRLIFVPGLAAVALFAGCSQSNSIGVTQRQNSWSTFSENIVPGIDQAAVTQVIMQTVSKEIYFVIWSDLATGASNSSATPGNAAAYSGSHRADPARSDNQRVLLFRVDSQGEPPINVTIDDVDYALADGNLFMVSTTSPQTKVLQLSVEKDELPGSKAGLMDFAKNRAEIMSFFGADVEEIPARSASE